MTSNHVIRKTNCDRPLRSSQSMLKTIALFGRVGEEWGEMVTWEGREFVHPSLVVLRLCYKRIQSFNGDRAGHAKDLLGVQGNTGCNTTNKWHTCSVNLPRDNTVSCMLATFDSSRLHCVYVRVNEHTHTHTMAGHTHQTPYGPGHTYLDKHTTTASATSHNWRTDVFNCN